MVLYHWCLHICVVPIQLVSHILEVLMILFSKKKRWRMAKVHSCWCVVNNWARIPHTIAVYIPNTKAHWIDSIIVCVRVEWGYPLHSLHSGGGYPSTVLGVVACHGTPPLRWVADGGRQAAGTRRWTARHLHLQNYYMYFFLRCRRFRSYIFENEIGFTVLVIAS